MRPIRAKRVLLQETCPRRGHSTARGSRPGPFDAFQGQLKGFPLICCGSARAVVAWSASGQPPPLPLRGPSRAASGGWINSALSKNERTNKASYGDHHFKTMVQNRRRGNKQEIKLTTLILTSRAVAGFFGVAYHLLSSCRLQTSRLQARAAEAEYQAPSFSRGR